jgi:hypothetical protein
MSARAAVATFGCYSRYATRLPPILDALRSTKIGAESPTLRNAKGSAQKNIRLPFVLFVRFVVTSIETPSFSLYTALCLKLK